jgi:hypothetical protein
VAHARESHLSLSVVEGSWVVGIVALGEISTAHKRPETRYEPTEKHGHAAMAIKPLTTITAGAIGGAAGNLLTQWIPEVMRTLELLGRLSS